METNSRQHHKTELTREYLYSAIEKSENSSIKLISQESICKVPQMIMRGITCTCTYSNTCTHTYIFAPVI